MNKVHTPLFHLTKRTNLSRSGAWLIRLGSFLAAIIIGGLIFVLLGQNPFEAYQSIITGSLGKSVALRQTIKIAVPLLGTAIAIAPCFKMRFWNIGAEGQITAGAIGATFFALNFAGKIPSMPLLLSMGIAGALCGAFWALIPAVFKAKWGTNETLFTLMMNYIVIGFVRWLQGGPWEGKPGSQIIPNFNPDAVLPEVFRIHCGWIIVLALTIFMYVYMKYSKHGYEIAVVGESHNTAKYAGMNVAKITIRTMLLSGAICGLVGFMVASGANKTLYHNVADGVGFTAITVAWLAQLKPFVMIVISLLLAILDKGSGELQTRMGVPSSISDIITGVFLFCMLASEFFINYRIIFTKSHKKEAAK
ncbi:MAG: ABC transporter permease [Clostridia bacterium]|nr:ABC transporter permease [Clostridia bacterium]